MIQKKNEIHQEYCFVVVVLFCRQTVSKGVNNASE